MTTQSYLMMGFDEQNQPVVSALMVCDLIRLDERAHNVLMLNPMVDRVLAWAVDGASFISRQAEPVCHVKLPWID